MTFVCTSFLPLSLSLRSLQMHPKRPQGMILYNLGDTHWIKLRSRYNSLVSECYCNDLHRLVSRRVNWGVAGMQVTRRMESFFKAHNFSAPCLGALLLYTNGLLISQMPSTCNYNEGICCTLVKFEYVCIIIILNDSHANITTIPYHRRRRRRRTATCKCALN